MHSPFEHPSLLRRGRVGILRLLLDLPSCLAQSNDVGMNSRFLRLVGFYIRILCLVGTIEFLYSLKSFDGIWVGHSGLSPMGFGRWHEVSDGTGKVIEKVYV